jgi:hypothetical protein
MCALLGYCAALRAGSVLTFRDSLSVPSSTVKESEKIVFFLDSLDFSTLEDGTHKLSRNVGTELPLNAV